MLKNYFKIAWRNLLKSKGFSFINLTGLSIGISACILISVYIIHETSYDKFVPDSTNIYRLVRQFNFGKETLKSIHFSANTARTIESDFGEIEQAGRIMDNDLFYGAGTNELQIDDEVMQHHEAGFAYADQAILDIFSIPMIFGDAKTALEEPKTIVISQAVSQKYFKDENPIGRVVYLNGNRDDPHRITAVMRDFPTNSHMDYQYFLTMKGVEFDEGEQDRWIQSNYFTYVRLRPDTDVSLFDQTFGASIIKKYLKPALAAGGYAMAEEIEDKASIYLQPMTDIQLYSADIGYESGFRNDIKIIWIFGTVALFILLLATINFVNLSTARSANRAKEVGLRKVVGSGRSNLVIQFLTESLVLTLMAFVLGVVLAQTFLPVFQKMTGIELSMPWGNQLFIPVLLLAALVVGGLAGFYPALYLSGFSPINVLKGKLRLGGKSSGFRSGLVVFQFTISIILIIGTLIINEQMSFILNSKVGFEKDQVIQLYGTNMLGEKDVIFKEELSKMQEVESVSISDYLPLENTKRNGNSFTKEGGENIDEDISGQVWQIDEDYLETLGIELIAGRNFDATIASDRDATIVNEQMVAELGLTDPIGKKVSRSGHLNEIIGVVKNFRYDNMKQRVMPLALFYEKSNTIISVKVNTADMPGLLKTIEKKWDEFAPNLSFRYAFMDDSFAQMYDNVYRIKTIFTSFAVLAIFVACMGLFALSAFMVEQRNKEMSIRKVLGASIQGIYRLQTQNFVYLVLISLLFAIPIAYYSMENWLKDYEYKIEISWQIFLVSGAVAISIALLTVSYHAFKSALINPVNNLKGE
ncbi:putative ABC transport system permease protein [Algoriphagus sp. 4150]|uniref:ABC transporter permease n=1 Tax=Algoriphagus sp. 4150 TaxID=2817756 RepID=UPI0028557264|nr:ABC transporter permease [Algoriphagus sp. 4150]MDR7132297.1 putative ABC transport system permease protein [Algoriphagus sp. 4150]